MDFSTNRELSPRVSRGSGLLWAWCRVSLVGTEANWRRRGGVQSPRPHPGGGSRRPHSGLRMAAPCPPHPYLPSWMCAWGSRGSPEKGGSQEEDWGGRKDRHGAKSPGPCPHPGVASH